MEQGFPRGDPRAHVECCNKEKVRMILSRLWVGF